MTGPRSASPLVFDQRTLSPALAKRRFLTAAFLGIFPLWFLMVITWRLRLGAGGFSVGDLTSALVAAYVVVMPILFLVPARLRISTEGIVLRWMGRRRLVGFDEIAGVVNFEKDFPVGWSMSAGTTYGLRVAGLHVVLRTGEEIAAAVVLRRSREKLDPIEHRLREAMATFQRSKTIVGTDLLRRGDRSLGAWVTALRALGAGANADARTAPVSRDQLLAIVEAPASPAPDRVAAAIALGSDLDDEARARLRCAGEGTEAPRLRIALEKASEGADPAEMEAMLAEIEGGEPSHGGRRRAR